MSQLVWLVTGCSSGFGSEFVHQILSRGDKIIATARNSARIQVLASQGASVLELDVTDTQDSIDQTIAKAIAIYGHIDVLVNNAGFVAAGSWEDLSYDDFLSSLETNVFGPIKVTRAVLPHMRARKSGTMFDRQIPHRSLPCFLVFVFDNDMKMLRSRLRWKYTEDDVAEAILDVTDNGFSPPQAAHRRGVPRRTLIDRLHGRGAVKEQIHPHRRLSKRQEDRLAFWILRQESLGYAPSHSQIRACVMGLLRQQGEHPNLGRNWVIKFINRRADLKTKMGRRQEAKRFDSFTPKAVHWYFDIRDGQYGWIKPENTVNVDEGGIMTGFGLDSLVVGSADPKRKAFLKGPQTRNWTSFIEAVTADGRALVPGIIFKGKELQKQWFLEEFRQIADWYYITSPNGWTDDHIGIEWLERVYLPQTTPADESDARLIISYGHGSHATPLDNGVFNALKAAYRRELERFASLTDSAPMDKVNFIRAYAKARRVGMTKKNILSGWRVTGNWPISRAKALRHPEIQQDRPNGSPRVTPEPRPYLGSDDTPQTSRQIRDLGLNKTPKTRRRYNVIAKGFEAHQQTVAAHTQRIASLEEELARLKRGKKRKAVPNPNKRFMTLGETLAGKESIPEGATRYTPIGVEFISSSEQESASEAGSVIEVREENIPHQPTRRSQRIVKKTRVQ
ncbi:hypothetical protein FPOA_13930 [Fusarium poae]|uniref:HTH CENPB-type domain-containing protein n=1 Tax=Fusarium poae TaxID=36050 RepID=A0A1B8A3Y9_FUSPO|nr:hypothetical protein FPOA_13930 [Fusarium poae]